MAAFANNSKVTPDAIDWKLLVALQEHGRLSFTDLGRLVKLTPPAVAEWVRRLEAAGVIRGYRAEVDPAQLGYTMTVVIRLAVPSGKHCTTWLAALEAIPEVLEAHRTTGTESAGAGCGGRVACRVPFRASRLRRARASARDCRAEVRGEVTSLRAELRQNIAAVRAELLKWSVAMRVPVAFAVLGLYFRQVRRVPP